MFNVTLVKLANYPNNTTAQLLDLSVLSNNNTVALWMNNSLGYFVILTPNGQPAYPASSTRVCLDASTLITVQIADIRPDAFEITCQDEVLGMERSTLRRESYFINGTLVEPGVTIVDVPHVIHRNTVSHNGCTLWTAHSSTMRPTIFFDCYRNHQLRYAGLTVVSNTSTNIELESYDFAVFGVGFVIAYHQHYLAPDHVHLHLAQFNLYPGTLVKTVQLTDNRSYFYGSFNARITVNNNMLLVAARNLLRGSVTPQTPGVFTQMFSYTLNAQSGLFRLNQNLSVEQDAFRVATLPSGKFIVMYNELKVIGGSSAFESMYRIIDPATAQLSEAPFTTEPGQVLPENTAFTEQYEKPGPIAITSNGFIAGIQHSYHSDSQNEDHYLARFEDDAEQTTTAVQQGYIPTTTNNNPLDPTTNSLPLGASTQSTTFFPTTTTRLQDATNNTPSSNLLATMAATNSLLIPLIATGGGVAFCASLLLALLLYYKLRNKQAAPNQNRRAEQGHSPREQYRTLQLQPAFNNGVDSSPVPFGGIAGRMNLERSSPANQYEPVGSAVKPGNGAIGQYDKPEMNAFNNYEDMNSALAKDPKAAIQRNGAHQYDQAELFPLKPDGKPGNGPKGQYDKPEMKVLNNYDDVNQALVPNGYDRVPGVPPTNQMLTSQNHRFFSSATGEMERPPGGVPPDQAARDAPFNV